MLHSSVEFFPRTEELRKKLRVPISIISSPTDDIEISTLDFPSDKLFMCKNPICHSYLTNRCEVSESTWTCPFCNTKNPLQNNEISAAQMTKSCFEVEIKSTPSHGLIYIIYFSREFEKSDFSRAKLAACSLLRHLPKEAKCLVIIGSDKDQFSLIVPSIKTNLGFKSRASIANFKSILNFAGLDLTRFFFTIDNSFEAEEIIDNISYSPDSNSHTKSLEFAKTFARILQNTPIHFISIINQIPDSTISLETGRPFFIRLDFLIAKYSTAIHKVSQELPGLLLFLSRNNSAAQANLIMTQKTRYQTICRCHSSNSKAQWKRPRIPFTDVAEQLMFIPVCTTSQQPIYFEVEIEPNHDSYSFQLVTKYNIIDGNKTRFLLRVVTLNKKSTIDFAEYCSGVDFNSVIWLWIMRVRDLGSQEAIAAIFRVASMVYKQTNEIRNIDDFLRGICSLPTTMAFQSNEVISYVGKSLINLTSPLNLKLIPDIKDIDGHKICSSINGIDEERNPNEEGPSKYARDLQMKFPVYIPVTPKIEKEFTKISDSRLALLHVLV